MTVYTNERMAAVSVIESLRAGVPTRASTRALSELRPEIIELIKENLNKFVQGERVPGRLILGDYGQGKTHALTTVEHIGLDMGFAVSRVSLSREVSCHNLGHFYNRVVATLRTPNSAIFGLRNDLNRKLGSDLLGTPIQETGRYIHPLPALILEDYFYTSGEEQDMLYGFLMGSKFSLSEFKKIHRANRGYTLPKFETNFKITEHAPAFFGLMADTVCLCNYKGWLILIDEVELISRLGKVSRLKAYRNLNWLLNWSGEMNYPIYVIGAAAKSLDDAFYGVLSSNKQPDSIEIPKMARDRYGETAQKEMENFFNFRDERCPQIVPVKEEQLTVLIKEIVKLHEEAYAWDADFGVHRFLHDLGSNTIRTCIRGALELLDMQYLYKETIIPETKELIAASLDEGEQFFSNEVDDDN